MHSDDFNNVLKCWAVGWIFIPALKHKFLPVRIEENNVMHQPGDIQFARGNFLLKAGGNFLLKADFFVAK
jgi:hypothetical protein